VKLNTSFALALATALVAYTSTANAISSTLGASYYEVLNGTGGPDFGGSGFPNVAIGSALGPDGLPVVNSGSPGISEYNPTTHEITWWSPAMNSAVLFTGSGIVTIPYGSNMYAPNSTGGNDSAAFETAVFSGTFNLAGPGSVNFNVQSDDDSFVYLNGILIGQNPGIHGVTGTTFTGNGLLGSNTLEIFYADREQTGAFLSVSADVTLTAAVPEPSTWAMMILGFFGVGFMAYRRKSQIDLRLA
jgi:hypothetical protein